MKIATWNVERLKHKRELDKIETECEKIGADILVLTETDTQIKLNYKNSFRTPMLSEIQPDYYKPTETRITIFTNYDLVCQHSTYDKYTALCVELETELGKLLVYGTIIGIYGNRNKNFSEDLTKQINDFKLLSSSDNLCVLGDYNLSFADNYYYTKQGRDDLLKSFNGNKIALLTKDRAECIDHIAISKNFLENTGIVIDEWNLSKSLSDHKGIYVDIISK